MGIAGGSGSGKTGLCEAIERSLGDGAVSRLQHDRYYHDLRDRTPAQRAQVNFDHPDSLETAQLVADIDTLRAGRAVDQPIYNFATHTRGHETQRVYPAPLLLVEGILVLHDPALRARMDLKIFVEVPDDIRLIRRIRRDLLHRGRSADQTMTQYIATVRPMHHRFVQPSSAHADLIVPNGYEAGSAGVIVAALGYLTR